MAQAGYTPISLYYSTTAAAVPTAGNLASGELAINITDGKLYYKSNAGVVTLLAGATAGPAGGSNTQVQFNSSGALAGSANLTWNGTSLSATQVDITGQGTLRLQDTTGGEYVALRAPATLGANYTLTFPADDGTSGQALITDGSGVLSWSTAASGDVYGPASATNNGIVLFDGTTGKLIKDSAASDGLIYGLTVGRGGGAVSTNTAVGYQAINATATGTQNVIVGYQAGLILTSGGNNTGIGRAALYSVTSGSDNTAVGQGAGSSSTTTSYNTSVGSRSLEAASGTYNTAVGYAAGASVSTSTGYNTFVGGLAGPTGASSTGNSNTAVGYQSLTANTTASNNTAIGYQAGYTNTTGTFNVFIGGQDGGLGKSAGYSNLSGSINTAIGNAALATNSTGGNNTAVGYRALSLSTVDNNTAFGAYALYVNSTGTANVALGRDALSSNTTASNNTAVGYQAAYTNTTATSNVAVGYQAGYSNNSNNTVYNGYQAGYLSTTTNSTAVGFQAHYRNLTGNNSVAIGYQALYGGASADADGCVAVGHEALLNVTTGDFNVALGMGTLKATSSGANNVAVGFNALTANSTASYNTGLGMYALASNTTASNNVAVGYQAGYTGTTNSYNTFIGFKAGYTSAVAGNGFNTCVGAEVGYSLTTGTGNTFIGGANTSSGYFVTSGSNNTILGGYTGNQDGLDIRTVSNYAVISDGAGNRQITMAEGQTLALDSAVPNTGTGITFPATQSASSNANTLDDYEEGTWTPAFVNIGTGTYTTQIGRYTKVGRLVAVECYLVLATLGTASGAAVISGLPFTCNNVSGTAQMWTNNFASLGQNVVGLVNTGTLLDLYSIPASGSVTGVSMSDLTGTSNVVFNFSYVI